MTRISSFFLKIFSGFFVIISLLIIFTFTTTFQLLKSNYINDLKSELEKINLTLSDQIVEKITQNNIDEFVKETGQKLKIRITVVDTMGIVLGDSERNPLFMENHRNRDEISYAFDLALI